MKYYIIMIKFVIIIIIILLLLFLLKYTYQKKYKFNNWHIPVNIINNKIIWIYWDDLNGIENRPYYITLCLNSIKKNTKEYNLIELNKNNIYYYLPELKEIEKNINLDKLKLAQKVDLYRIMLLYKYGGLYLDTDTILLKSPDKLYKLLDEYDYIGYGCTGNICYPKNSYGRPSNSIMLSRKNTELMLNIFNNIINKLQDDIDFKNPDNYFVIGKYIIWYELDLLIKKGYKYYHVVDDIGIRDTNGKWVTADRLFSNEKFNFINEDNLIMILLYNNMMDNLKKIKKEDIDKSDWKIKQFI